MQSSRLWVFKPARTGYLLLSWTCHCLWHALTVAFRPTPLLVFRRDQYGIHRRPVHFMSGITAKHYWYFLGICDSSQIDHVSQHSPF
ncbi:hypothetical protein EDC04DRAFT_943128 [Pisolithus marmoratus]|nr:hypothetical protein EDC04DRAFT_943128 [Pisolithus marmoratus]